MRRKESVEQGDRIHRGARGHRLGQVGQSDQQEQDEGNRGQQRIEGQRAGQKRQVVLVGGLERTAKEPGE